MKFLGIIGWGLLFGLMSILVHSLAMLFTSETVNYAWFLFPVMIFLVLLFYVILKKRYNGKLSFVAFFSVMVTVQIITTPILTLEPLWMMLINLHRDYVNTPDSIVIGEYGIAFFENLLVNILIALFCSGIIYLIDKPTSTIKFPADSAD